MTINLQLPDVLEKGNRIKRRAGEPDFSTLKPQQSEAVNKMVEFLSSPGGGIFLLKGYAGTGKTYCISRVLEWYLANRRGQMVAVTAPTNKAVKVLMEASEYTHVNLEYQTIHRLMGLKPEMKSEKLAFKQDRMFPPAIEEKSLLVIDEGSMLDDELFVGSGDRMFTPIEEYTRLTGLKIIIMGDPAQIPPVGRPEAISMTDHGQHKYGIEVFELTEIQRQALDNPIIEATFKIRSSIGRPTSFPLRETSLTGDGSGVIFLDRKVPEDSDTLYEALETYFCSPNFKADSDFCKVIAWRNKTVDYFNDLIRNMIYQSDKLPRLMVGEKLICNKPVVEADAILFNTNDEMEVTEFEPRLDQINGGKFQLQYYWTKVKAFGVGGEEYSHKIKVIHEDSLEGYFKIVDMLKKHALSKPKGSLDALNAWKDFYAFQEMYADVNYNYAITAHKAQGSTYDRVFVVESDINANFNIVERNRIKYTACSRPRYQLFIL